MHHHLGDSVDQHQPIKNCAERLGCMRNAGVAQLCVVPADRPLLKRRGQINFIFIIGDFMLACLF